MNIILLDSDILIWYLRGKEEVCDCLDLLFTDQGTMITCSILSYFEIKRGAWAKELSAVDKLFEALAPLAVTKAIMDQAIFLYQKYPKMRSVTDDLDYIIAATAITHEAQLFTANKKHFPFMELSLFQPNLEIN